MKYKGPILHILKVALLLLIVSYFGSTGIFFHTHYLDGKTVVHSHPYKEKNAENEPGHSHTRPELLLIQKLSTFDAADFTSIIIFDLFFLKPVLFQIEEQQISILNLPIACFRLRPPPVFIVK